MATRIEQKASAVVQAWRLLGWGVPTKSEVTMALLPPLGPEGNAGDTGGTWKNEGNWGSTTTRPINANERAALARAGISPTVDKTHEARENHARRVLYEARLPWQGLHGDSSAATGPYFVFFYCADRKLGDVDGARYYLKGWRRGNVAAAAAAGDIRGVAEAMYQNHYYMGVHPHDGGAGDDANVSAYEAGMHAVYGTVVSALANWNPTDPDIKAPSLAPVPVPPPLGRGNGASGRSVALPVAATVAALIGAGLAAYGWTRGKLDVW